MAAAMTSCSAAVFIEKSIPQVLHLQHQDFRERFRKKVFRAKSGFYSK